VPAPVDSMDGLWTESERLLVESRLGVAAIGSPETVQQKLARFLSQTNVDELIFTSDLFDHRDRIRSFEIAAEAMKMLDATELQRI
jgi:alkanesulfonate monooxygenase SsuD/methylene tetrahydromethanopterin reductase-like flavin-dependent oxidoreductase (luciferase family)